MGKWVASVECVTALEATTPAFEADSEEAAKTMAKRMADNPENWRGVKSKGQRPVRLTRVIKLWEQK